MKPSDNSLGDAVDLVGIQSRLNGMSEAGGPSGQREAALLPWVWFLCLVVLGALVLFFVIRFGASILEHRRRVQSVVEIRAWEIVLTNYQARGGFTNFAGSKDVAFGPGTQGRLLNELTGAGGTQPVLMSVSSSSIKLGEFVDPWGEPYRIVIDANGDGVCDTPFGPITNKGAVIWTSHVTPK